MGKLTSTHTFVDLEVSESTYNEIRDKLEKAQYFHTLDGLNRIIMYDIAIVKEKDKNG